MNHAEHEDVALTAFVIEHWALDPEDARFESAREAVRGTYEFKLYALRSYAAMAGAELREAARRWKRGRDAR